MQRTQQSAGPYNADDAHNDSNLGRCRARLALEMLVLVPATVIGSAAALGATVTQGNGLWFLLLALVLVIFALQIGYLSGAFLAPSPRERGIAKTRMGSSRPFNGRLADQSPAFHQNIFHAVFSRCVVYRSHR